MSRRVELYGFHDRLWHWIQAFTVIGLLASGLGLRYPEAIPGVAFPTLLSVHLGLGAFLALNAGLGLFYFLTSGAIGHYVPQPKDMFSLSLAQARYYLRGIFRDDPHPFQKSEGRRLNPLQKLTYLAILNVLLPWQLLSGGLLWGMDGALAVGWALLLGPLHAFGAWLFVAFLVAHVYLTTTGETPLSNLRAMVTGWEEFPGDEAPASPPAEPEEATP